MDTFLIIAGIILLLGGIAGCIIPFLPGPPLAYGSLILLQISSYEPFSEKFLVIWALATLVILIADYYIPIWGTKKFGGTKGGVWGATIGLILGIFFFPPVGLIVGPFIGAFAGEMLNNQDSNKALRSAIGSFVGFVAGTLMKLGISIVMGYYFFTALW
jgi:uncharacterized protein YqgC (DUF456 family)